MLLRFRQLQSHGVHRFPEGKHLLRPHAFELAPIARTGIDPGGEHARGAQCDNLRRGNGELRGLHEGSTAFTPSHTDVLKHRACLEQPGDGHHE